MTDARRKILERRAAFVAAAIGAIAAGADCTKPQPCLSAVPEEKYKPDAGATPDASAASGDDAELAQPTPCLSEAPAPPPDAPKPMPCLKIAPPKDSGY